MNAFHRARPGKPAHTSGQAFAAHRITLYLMVAAALIDQLIP